MTKWHMRIACWIPKATNTLTIWYDIFVNCNWVATRWHCTIHIYTQCTERHKTNNT